MNFIKNNISILKEKFEDLNLENFNEVKKSYFHFIESKIVPAIKIHKETSKNVTLGMSKIGGTPHLPSYMDWPMFNKEHMVFLAQLNLSEITFHDNENYFPKSGILFFFAYFNNPVNKFGAQYDFIQPKQKYKVLFHDVDNIFELRETSFPKSMIFDYQFKESAISFTSFFSIPNDIYEYAEWEDNLSENDYNLIIDFHDEISEDSDTYQISGVPVPVQDSVAADWAYAYMEYDYECDKDIDIEELEEEFINILSMPIFSKIGDSQAYFGIRKDDLANKNFDNCVFIMQGS